jgi:hypothetical protein
MERFHWAILVFRHRPEPVIYGRLGAPYRAAQAADVSQIRVVNQHDNENFIDKFIAECHTAGTAAHSQEAPQNGNKLQDWAVAGAGFSAYGVGLRWFAARPGIKSIHAYPVATHKR